MARALVWMRCIQAYYIVANVSAAVVGALYVLPYGDVLLSAKLYVTM